MTRKLLVNIKQLLQVGRDEKVVAGIAMKELPQLQNAFLLIENESIVDYGHMNELPTHLTVEETIDCTGRVVMPTWYDSHTHIVYAGNREQEFVDRINGLSYEEIAANGGGILNSAKKLQNSNFDDLYHQSAKRLEEVIELGIGGIEIKSGYGLTVEAELKMLKVIKHLKENYSIPIKATFLGAHAIPDEFKTNKEGYIDLILLDECLLASLTIPSNFPQQIIYEKI